jgi:hypothetical protein
VGVTTTATEERHEIVGVAIFIICAGNPVVGGLTAGNDVDGHVDSAETSRKEESGLNELLCIGESWTRCCCEAEITFNKFDSRTGCVSENTCGAEKDDGSEDSKDTSIFLVDSDCGDDNGDDKGGSGENETDDGDNDGGDEISTESLGESAPASSSVVGNDADTDACEVEDVGVGVGEEIDDKDNEDGDVEAEGDGDGEREWMDGGMLIKGEVDVKKDDDLGMVG